MLEQVVVALLIAKSAADAPFTAPSVPVAIQVPAGATPKLKLHATGVQVYACTAPEPGRNSTFAWMLVAPEATLFDLSGAKVGTHRAGPAWILKDGSSVNGQKLAQSDAPIPDAVPWLLIRANGGEGRFATVTYVQRLNTKGGKAPTTGCDEKSLGTKARVEYSADYYFFEQDAAGSKAK
jgi:hypothetical protein